jgi:hypothetical protein
MAGLALGSNLQRGPRRIPSAKADCTARGRNQGDVVCKGIASPTAVGLKARDVDRARIVVGDQYVRAICGHVDMPLRTLRYQGACQMDEQRPRVRLACMQLNLAQVLNTVAHEIRTPLAVSQGYLKLYLDGRLTNADDQRRAFQQTRDALGTLATLCTDMSKVSALSEKPSPALLERVAPAQFVERLKGATEVEGAAWSGDIAAPAAIASNGVTDLVHAVAIVAKAAFDEAREAPRAMHVQSGFGPHSSGDGAKEFVMLAGSPQAVSALEAGAGAGTAPQVNFTKGGKGLRLIWAAFVLQQHRVHTWTHPDHRNSVGFRFPLVQA